MNERERARQDRLFRKVTGIMQQANDAVRPLTFKFDPEEISIWKGDEYLLVEISMEDFETMDANEIADIINNLGATNDNL